MLVTIITGWGHRGRWRELDDWLLIGFIDTELLQLAVDWAETSALYGLCWLPKIRSWGHLGSPVFPVPLWDPPPQLERRDESPETRLAGFGLHGPRGLQGGLFSQ